MIDLISVVISGVTYLLKCLMCVRFIYQYLVIPVIRLHFFYTRLVHRTIRRLSRRSDVQFFSERKTYWGIWGCMNQYMNLGIGRNLRWTIILREVLLENLYIPDGFARAVTVAVVVLQVINTLLSHIGHKNVKMFKIFLFLPGIINTGSVYLD